MGTKKKASLNVIFVDMEYFRALVCGHFELLTSCVICVNTEVCFVSWTGSDENHQDFPVNERSTRNTPHHKCDFLTATVIFKTSLYWNDRALVRGNFESLTSCVACFNTQVEFVSWTDSDENHHGFPVNERSAQNTPHHECGFFDSDKSIQEKPPMEWKSTRLR